MIIFHHHGPAMMTIKLNGEATVGQFGARSDDLQA
jgi:hypothetical protein